MMQSTIGKAVSFEGVGVFSGNKVKITLAPAAPDTGVVFIRSDLKDSPRIPATVDFAQTRYRHTCLVNNDASVETVEHLLASLHGFGIDNLEITIDAPELPVGDGSANEFIKLLQSAGKVMQDSARKEFALKAPVAIEKNGVSLVALPSDDKLTVDYTLKYDAPIIGTQNMRVSVNQDEFLREIAPARTFCLAEEIEQFNKMGLGKGGSYKNTLVVDKDKVVDNELRFPNEFVRHKILDLIGDLFLLNVSLKAHIIALKTGHEDNLNLVKALHGVINSIQPAYPAKRETLLDVREIQNILPHRYPFLLIDKVIKMEGYSRVVGLKNATANEHFFQGHFPGQPVMPAVLQLEAMAQLAGVLLLRRAGNEKKLGILMAIDGAKLRKSVVPGDQLFIEAETIRYKTRTAEVHGKILVDGELVSEADFKFMLVDKEN
ncbi:MAG: UDP-3-O-[3-hydroxymyristoyl] N-acetylglucosamine deacetylase [Planctomycetes bacterium]|nr:UDP-3-O-[3-hydroxymyristoyl] N-acetylglucosamine deacetylase [Planctomycetota bacterium]